MSVGDAANSNRNDEAAPSGVARDRITLQDMSVSGRLLLDGHSLDLSSPGPIMLMESPRKAAEDLLLKTAPTAEPPSDTGFSHISSPVATFHGHSSNINGFVKPDDSGYDEPDLGSVGEPIDLSSPRSCDTPRSAHVQQDTDAIERLTQVPSPSARGKHSRARFDSISPIRSPPRRTAAKTVQDVPQRLASSVRILKPGIPGTSRRDNPSISVPPESPSPPRISKSKFLPTPVRRNAHVAKRPKTASAAGDVNRTSIVIADDEEDDNQEPASFESFASVVSDWKAKFNNEAATVCGMSSRSFGHVQGARLTSNCRQSHKKPRAHLPLSYLRSPSAFVVSSAPKKPAPPCVVPAPVTSRKRQLDAPDRASTMLSEFSASRKAVVANSGPAPIGKTKSIYTKARPIRSDDNDEHCDDENDSSDRLKAFLYRPVAKSSSSSCSSSILASSSSPRC